MLAKQDGKEAIRNIIGRLKEKYGMRACDVSGILAELLAESRDAELTEIMWGLARANEENGDGGDIEGH